MTKQEFTEFKQNKEAQIQNSLTAALGIRAEAVKIKYDIDKVEAAIEMLVGDTENIYHFTATEDVFTFKSMGYKVLFTTEDNTRIVNGIQAAEVTIDLATLLAIQKIMTTEEESVEPAEVEMEEEIHD